VVEQIWTMNNVEGIVGATAGVRLAVEGDGAVEATLADEAPLGEGLLAKIIGAREQFRLRRRESRR
jgi:hypothetical protein